MWHADVNLYERDGVLQPGDSFDEGGRSGTASFTSFFPLPAGQPLGLGRRGWKAPSASAVSPVSGVSVVWTVVSPVSMVWTVVPPVCGVCVIWTVVPRIVVSRIVVTPISVVTIPVPIGGASAQYRRYKKNNQENRDGFSHSLAPLVLHFESGRGVLCASIHITMGWVGLFNVGEVSGGGDGGGNSPDIPTTGSSPRTALFSPSAPCP